MEVKNNYAYVTTQRILNKFIESQIIIGINKNVICFNEYNLALFNLEEMKRSRFM